MIPYPFICIEGNIGAGKTTLASKLAAFTGSRLLLEEFEENPYLPLFYQNPERYALQTELTFLTDRYKQLASQLAASSLFQPGLIADYYLLKSRLFARNNLNDTDFRLYDKIFQIVEASLPKPGMILYLHHEPPILLEHIRDRGRAYELTITESYLIQIQNAYLQWLKTESRFPVLMLDMKTYEFINTPQELQGLLELLQQSYPPGLHRAG